MTIAFWCVLIAGCMPLVAVGIAKWDKRYDNNAPRDWLARQEGAKKRAYAAHLNSFEAFPFFASAVIIASMAKAPGAIIDGLAVLFVIARIIYIWCYITDKASLRSAVWMVAFGATVALFVTAGVAGI
jgi:uncharacterized MAPEG superfamily protein